MMQETRIMATIFYFAGMGLTLFAALGLKPENRLQKLFILIGVGVQMCAYFWYSLTFIPFGRRIFKSMCKKCFSGVTE